MLVYAKNSHYTIINGLPMSEEDAKIYDQQDEKGRYLIRPLRRTGGEDRREDRPTMFFPITAPDGTLVYPMGPTGYESRWICSPETVSRMQAEGMLAWKKVARNGEEQWQVYQKFYLENRTKAAGNLWHNIEGNKKATRDIRTTFDGQKVFDFPKPLGVIIKTLLIGTSKDSIILDFFSGSATTAHAVMQLNAEDGGNRRFIMVQWPEVTNEDSEAYKAGYKNICEIGKERIRRAGKKVKEEAGLQGQNLDTGFRVLKLDESNMADVYYTPADTPIQQTLNFDALVDNIREGRTAEDLLFQVLPECNLPLSSKIEIREIHGKKVFVVEEGYLMACFDNDINDAVITAIAKEKPYYFVMCDRSIASDSVADNFDQIFNAYSKETVRRIL
jgi:adenine-specific DNA-methyltransferase